MMTRTEILQTLQALAQKLGARVIYDDLTFPGGWCLSKRQLYIVLKDRAPIDEKLRILAEGVSQLDWEGEVLPPEVQNLLIPRRQ